MPHFKTETFSHRNAAGGVLQAKLKININSAGEFYCTPEPDLLEVIRSIPGGCGISHTDTKLFSTEFELLKDRINEGLKLLSTPVTKVEHVIRYNIESKVKFAMTPDGEIFPNGYFHKEARWLKSDALYGGLHACQQAKGGYALVIGAEALEKTTIQCGGHQKISYRHYYKGESHLGTENPAQKLNSWVGVGLDAKTSREMPYSDEAALFFFDLMMSMAKISKVIQEGVGTQEGLDRLIANNVKLLGARHEI